MSTFTVMRRLMGNRNEVADSGWHEFGSVPPDAYTAVIAEPGNATRVPAALVRRSRHASARLEG